MAVIWQWCCSYSTTMREHNKNPTNLPPETRTRSSTRWLARFAAAVLGLGSHVHDQRSGRREQGQGKAAGHGVVVFDREGPLALVGHVFGVVTHLCVCDRFVEAHNYAREINK